MRIKIESEFLPIPPLYCEALGRKRKEQNHIVLWFYTHLIFLQTLMSEKAK
jgi:hypothetical protein